MYEFLKGVGVALVTPFNKNLRVDYDSLEKLIGHILESKVSYILLHGTTGESATTSLDEKKEILKFVSKLCKNKKEIILGLGSNNTKQILNDVKEFDLDSVKAILSVCPYYNKPTQEGIYSHYKAISENSPLPIILYNVPSRTSVNISAKTTKKLSRLKNIIGIKESSGDFSQIFEISQEKDNDFHLICGNDSDIIPMSSLGSTGVISVLANAYPSTISNILKNSLDKNFEKARKIAFSLYSLDKLMYTEGNPVGIKQLLNILNLVDYNVRLPLYAASSCLKSEIEVAITKLGISNKNYI